MNLPKLLLLSTLFTMPLAAAMAPVRALELNAAGWSFTPVTGSGTPDGECPTVDAFSCYTALTPTAITIVGQEGAGATPTYAYTLPALSPAQQVSFAYSYDSNGNADSVAFYQLGSASATEFNPASGTVSFLWNPGDSLAFFIQLNSDSSWTGELSITNFSSQDATPVPAPLPMGGAIGLMAWSRALRRRIRAAADAGSSRF